jgi:hypothetical protein
MAWDPFVDPYDLPRACILCLTAWEAFAYDAVPDGLWLMLIQCGGMASGAEAENYGTGTFCATRLS